MRSKIMLTGLICLSLIIPAAFFISCSDVPPESTGDGSGGGAVAAGTGDNGAAASSTVASLILLSSSPQLDSDGMESVTLTTLIRDANNNLMSDVSVTFSADSGAIQVVRGVSEDAGTATATLTTAGNQANRDIAVTATSGSITAQTIVAVRGTNINIDGLSTTTIGQTVDLTVTLLDSSGVNGISGEIITVSSTVGNAIVDKNNTSFVTDANGKITASVTVNDAGSGTDTITASALFATGSHTLSISTDDVFAFTTPSSLQEINLNTCQQVRINWTDIDGAAKVNQPINFSTTRGQLYSNAACTLAPVPNFTDGSGNSTVYISSTNSGFAGIYAVGNPLVPGPSTQVEVEFVATTAASLILQADPTLIGVNTIGSTAKKQSQIIAIVRDANNNLVKNKVIDFTITEDFTNGELTGSPATTNSYGSASAIFIAGAVTGGVQIEAVVQDTPAITDTVALTVSGVSLFVTLGTGNTIFAQGNVSYSYPYGVWVVDAAGGPVENARVTLSVISDSYTKGWWTWPDGGPAWVRTISAGPCANEDIDQNGVLGVPPDVDTNSNGSLEPGNVATVVLDPDYAVSTSPPIVKTDSEGKALFNIIYPKDHAMWISVTLTAQAVTAGSEGQESVSFLLPILAADVTNQNISPPGNPSPLGIGNACSDPN